MKQRENWGSKLGVILAVAGSAVGLGNFLRFPVQAAQNGGGAFIIPYFAALVFLGIPLMLIEWTAGRFGGGFGHGTAPGIFHSMWRKNRFIKYFGVVGIFGPIIIFIYYTYIESWLLGYAFFSLTSRYASATSTLETMKEFLRGYQGATGNPYFGGLKTAYLFFVLTFAANILVVYYGIKKGIEKLATWAMPLLFILGIIITIRVLTLGVVDLAMPDRNPINGLGFLWNPDFSQLRNAKVWLAAAGQVFFTLSVGIGVILTYASYLKKRQDVVLSGLTSAMTNEFVEVVLGASIVIPAAVTFFGVSGATDIAKSGAFNLSFVTMPLIFTKIPLGAVWAFMWFALLFLAGITSSVSLATPAISFLEDEFDISKKDAVMIFGAVTFVLCQPAIFLLGQGVVDELDFWGGTFCLVLFAAIEVILFSWVFGIDKAWDEMHLGADIRVPRFYRFIIKYVTPTLLLTILGVWFYQEGLSVILMKNVAPENRSTVLYTRINLASLFAILCVLVKTAWRRREKMLAEGKI
ncbi:MAG: sodium-dependent transporter [Endomicrobiia bacterium]|nr:sodium-dependent transporter [Endomicrobiia bacterium]